MQALLQLRNHVVHGRRPVRRPLGEHPLEEPVQRFRGVRARGTKRRNGLVAVREQLRLGRLTRKDRSANQQEMERAAQAVDVGADVDRNQ